MSSYEMSILVILSQYPKHKDNLELIEKLSLPVQEIAKGIVGLPADPNYKEYSDMLLGHAESLERDRKKD